MPPKKQRTTRRRVAGYKRTLRRAKAPQRHAVRSLAVRQALIRHKKPLTRVIRSGPRKGRRVLNRRAVSSKVVARAAGRIRRSHLRYNVPKRRISDRHGKRMAPSAVVARRNSPYLVSRTRRGPAQSVACISARRRPTVSKTRRARVECRPSRPNAQARAVKIAFARGILKSLKDLKSPAKKAQVARIRAGLGARRSPARRAPRRSSRLARR